MKEISDEHCALVNSSNVSMPTTTMNHQNFTTTTTNNNNNDMLNINFIWANNNPGVLSHELSLLAALAFVALVVIIISWLLRIIITNALLVLRILFFYRHRAANNFNCKTTTSLSSKKQSDNYDKGKASSDDSDQSNIKSSSSKATTNIIITTFLFLLAIELPVLLSTPSNSGLHDLIQGTDPLLNEILSRVPSIQRGPSPPLLLRNRHIQFIPFMIQNEIHRREGIPFQRIVVEVSDCIDKMKMDAADTDTDTTDQQCSSSGRMMNDTITLDIFPPFNSHNDIDENNPTTTTTYYHSNLLFNQSSPIILYAPGLRCHSQDMPGNSMIRKAYGAGFRSIVMNRRGHTPNQVLTSPRWNLFGDVDDMEQIYWYIKRHLLGTEEENDTAKMFLYGISSGTAITVTALSKWDKRKIDQPEMATPTFVASVDVSPGYDISKVLTRERFLWPYNDILMQGVKDHFVVQNEELLRSHDNEAVDKALGARSLQEIVDASVKFAGYDNVTQYYEDTNPINEVRDITTPKLVLNAMDDPCCNINNLYEESPYPQHEGKTFAQMIRETKRGMVAVTYTGSHCPFLCTWNKWLPFVTDPMNGMWMLNSWADEVTIEYYKAALDVYG